jgi:uncharacterized protein
MFVVEQINQNKIIFSPFQDRLFLLDLSEYKKYIERKDLNEFKNKSLLISSGKRVDLERREENTAYIVIFLTTNCNLRCKYCYAKGGEESMFIDFDFVKKGIDRVIKPTTKKLELGFHGGGEQTLAFDLIKKIVKYARSKIKQAKVGIESNGVIDKNILKWLLDNKVGIQISCDGPPEIQDNQRPFANGRGSGYFVTKTIKTLVKNGFHPHIRTTITEYSVKKQVEILKYFHNLGIKSIRFQPVITTGRAVEDNSVYGNSPNFEDFREYFLRAKELAEEYGIRLNTTYVPIDRTHRFFCGSPDYCLTTDGFVSACFEVVLGKNGPEQFVYGKYDKKTKKIVFDEKKINLFKKRAVDNIPTCRNCFLKHNCAGYCYMQTFRDTGDIFVPNKDRCKNIQETTRKYFEYRVNKELIKIKPYLKMKGKDIFYSMFFNEIRLKRLMYNQKLLGNVFLKAKLKGVNLQKLVEKIKSSKPTILIFSPEFEENDVNEVSEEKIIQFFETLENCRIWFKITKPIPKCMLKSKYDEIVEKFKIPKNCEECQELFLVREDDSIRFCNSHTGKKKISDYENRNEIYREFMTHEKNGLKKCNLCIYKRRGQCNGLCTLEN